MLGGPGAFGSASASILQGSHKSPINQLHLSSGSPVSAARLDPDGQNSDVPRHIAHRRGTHAGEETEPACGGGRGLASLDPAPSGCSQRMAPLFPGSPLPLTSLLPRAQQSLAPSKTEWFLDGQRTKKAWGHPSAQRSLLLSREKGVQGKVGSSMGPGGRIDLRHPLA